MKLSLSLPNLHGFVKRRPILTGGALILGVAAIYNVEYVIGYVFGGAVFLLFVLYLGLVAISNLNFFPINAFVAFIFNFSTVWAPGYSVWGFHNVHVGDSQADVVEKLGEPLEKTDHLWLYTASRKPLEDVSYHGRSILFNENGNVVRKISAIIDKD
ncbi:MAG: hypothetical protein OXT67_05820 [Zetaproteobacteria bacterium]|nr:hypothetical protein [Zetaproteobacteria bacterium]